MQVTKDGIERVKAAKRAPSAVIAERGIEIRKKGRVLVARCPFHEEKTPSFTITPAKGLYHCFGCGAAGDVIGFVTKHDKVSFGGALEALARRAGLDLGRLMEGRPQIRQRTPLAALTPPRNGEKRYGLQALGRGRAPTWRAGHGRPVSGRGALPPDLQRAGGRAGVPREARPNGPRPSAGTGRHR